MRIALMGMGRLGRSLSIYMQDNPALEATSWRRGEPVPTDVDLFWICVPDHAIAEVAKLIPQGEVVLHASGVRETSVLRPHRPAGSLHPLQSFPGPELALPDPRNLPAAIAGDPPAVHAAEQLARLLGFLPFELPGDRRAYHAAAVIAGNFGTALMAEASRLMGQAGVDPETAPRLLAPLATASIQQAVEKGPASALTGPFARGDKATIQAHLQLLEQTDPQLAEIYRLLGRACLRLKSTEGQLNSGVLGELSKLLD